MHRLIKRQLSGVLAAVMLVTSIPMTALAAPETAPKATKATEAAADGNYLEEREINESIVEDGAFCLGSIAADLKEEDDTPQLLRVVRVGDSSKKASVRLNMMDMTAKYGEDYTVKLADRKAGETDVQNATDSMSIKDVMESEVPVEYNYSDAVVEGLITAENQLSEEEQEEELKALEESLMKPEATEATGSNATVSEDEPAEESDEDAEYLKMLEDQQIDAGADQATGSDAAESEDEPEKKVAVKNLKLSKLKELQTGITNDKIPMTSDGSTGLMEVDLDPFGEAGLESYFTDSRADALSELNSTYLVIDFEPGVSERFIEIKTIDDSKGVGDVQAQFTLAGVDGSLVCSQYDSFTMTIVDDEEYELDKVSFSAEEYFPKNGYITVVLNRSGSLNEIACVTVDTESITAEPSVNFSEVHAEAYFAYGIKERTIKIPVVSTGLKEDVQFKIKIQEPIGCELGDISEAICNVRTSDASFKAAAVGEDKEEADVENVLSAQSSGTENTEVDQEMGPKSIVYENYQIKGDALRERCLERYESPTHGSVMWVDGNHWEVYVGHDGKGSHSSIRLDVSKDKNGKSAKHLDWNGMRVSQHMTIAGDAEVYEYLKGERRRLLWDCGKKTGGEYNIFSKEEYPDAYDFAIYRKGLNIAPVKFRIYWIQPIKRIFKFTLLDSDTIQLIDEQGQKRNNTESAYLPFKEATQTVIQNGSETTKTYYMVSDRSMTVALSSGGTTKDRISYISGLEIVKGDKSEVFWTAPDGEYPSSATFTLTNDWLTKYRDMYELKDNDGNGKYGDIQVRAIVKNYPVTIDVKKDDRCKNIKLWDGAGKVKTGTEAGDIIRYTYSRGDVVRYEAELTEEASVGYYWGGVTITTDATKENPKTLHVTDKLKYVQDDPVMNHNQTVTMHIPMKDNAVVVRVADRDDECFNHNKGIFKEAVEVKKEGGYVYYTLDKDATRIPWHQYELLAVMDADSKDYVPVWQEVNHPEKYCQNYYYFEGKLQKSENVIYLTVQRASKQKQYEINGSIYYDTALVGETTGTEGWYPGSGVWAFLDRDYYGVGDPQGKFQIKDFKGFDGYYVKLKIGTAGAYIYRTIKLSGSTSKDNLRIVIKSSNPERPQVTKLFAYGADKKGVITKEPLKFVTIANESTMAPTMFYAETTDLNFYGKPVKYTYIDDDKPVEAVESVKSVEFVVFDGKTHEEKSIYKLDKDKEKEGTWSTVNYFKKGNYAKFAAGDYIYARMTTDRKVDDGHKLLATISETVYPPVNTGLQFAEEQVEQVVPADIPIGTDGAYRLPIIGSLTTMLSVRKLSFGIQKTADYGFRVYFGATIKPKGSHFDEKGALKNDAWVLYKSDGIKNGMADMIKELSSPDEISNAYKMGIGLSAWNFSPIAGVYFEFNTVIIKNQTASTAGDDGTRIVFRFVGGGAYVGFITSFRYTYYMMFGPVPSYIGGDVSLQMMLELGAARVSAETDNMYFNKLDQAFINELSKKAHFDFLYRATLYGNAYAGVGICKALGVRGGFSLNFYFITNPLVKRTYPSVTHSTGFQIQGSINFWTDVVLFSLNLTPFLNKTWKFGYFKDIDKIPPKAQDDEQDEEPVEIEINSKRRENQPSKFIANSQERIPYEGAGEWESVIQGRGLIDYAYDDASVQIMQAKTPLDTTSKVLMVYLEDDIVRDADERTRLMYSVYTDDAQDGFWSSPVPVESNVASPSSLTADFSPSLCDRGDDILITWTSRKEPVGDGAGYAEHLKTLQVYTARYIKATEEITDVTQVTDDECFYVNPKAVYDSKTGKTFLFYMKSEVDDVITTGEQLLKNANPMTNKGELAYRVFDSKADGGNGAWMTEYYAHELPADPVMAEFLKAQLGGERFIASPITGIGINNPVVSDYDLTTATLHPGCYEVIRKVCDKAGINANLVIAGDETECAKLEKYLEDHPDEIKAIEEKTTDYGIYAFVVDSDNKMDTTTDREIYVQHFDPATHKYSAPRKITDNQVGEGSLKIVNTGETAYLFWLEDGSTETLDGEALTENSRRVVYIDLAEVMDDGTELPELYSVGSLKTGDRQEGSSITDYSVFVDSKDNLYMSWRENSVVTDVDTIATETSIQQDLYMAAKVYASTSEAGSTWSDGVKMTNNSGINGVPAIAEINDGNIMLISNAYQVDLNEGYEAVTHPSMNEVVFTPTGFAAPSAAVTDKIPENAGEKMEVEVTFKNEGIETSGAFSYELQLFDGTKAVSDSVSGNVTGMLQAGNSLKVAKELTLTEDIAQTSEDLVLKARTVMTSGKIGETERNLNLDNALPVYAFSDVTVTQQGEEFLVTGNISNTGKVNGDKKDVLVISDTDGQVRCCKPLSELEDDRMDFTARFNITDDIEELGRVSLVLTVKRNDAECAVPCYQKGYMNYPIGFKINGSDSNQLVMTKGQSIRLDGTFRQSLCFGESDMLYTIDDNSLVATLNGNVLRANKTGVTTLTMTTELFGGSKTVTVIVREAPAPKSRGGSSGGSSDQTLEGPAGAVQLSGSWKQNKDGTWSFMGSDGKAVTGWGKTGSGNDTEYYHFSENGIMDKGWYLDADGSWYYLHEAGDRREGAMDRGWHLDSRDGNWYYLDPKTGKMKVGWIYDNGNYYYLSEDKTGATWVQMAGGYWTYSGRGRAYGSMYRNEKTPDNKTVDNNGALITQ